MKPYLCVKGKSTTIYCGYHGIMLAAILQDKAFTALKRSNLPGAVKVRAMLYDFLHNNAVASRIINQINSKQHFKECLNQNYKGKNLTFMPHCRILFQVHFYTRKIPFARCAVVHGGARVFQLSCLYMFSD